MSDETMRTRPLSHRRRLRPGTGTILLALIVVAIVPVTVVQVIGVPVPFTAAVATGYAVQTGIVVFVASRWRIQPRDPWIWIALVYGILQLATLLSVGFRYGTYDLMDLMGAVAGTVGIVVYTGLVQAMRPDEADLRKFLTGFLWLTLAAIIVNSVLHAQDIPQLLSASSSYQFELSSFFANRNQFGYFLFLSIVAHALHLAGRRPRLHNVGLFGLQIVSLLLTMSRGSIAATIIFAFVFALLQLRMRARYFIAAVMAAATAGTIMLLTDIGSTVRDLVLRPSAALAGRDVVWGIGLDIWREHGILLGSGGFRGVTLAQEHGMEFSEFHSFLIETLVSGGLAELLFLLAVLALVWTQVAKSSLDSRRRHVLFASAAGVAGLSCVESVSLFTIGLVGTIFTIFFISLPLLCAEMAPPADRNRHSLPAGSTRPLPAGSHRRPLPAKEYR